MHFTADHDFDAPRALVAQILCDPDFQTQVDLPDLARPTVVEHTVNGPVRLLRLRYGYTGQIDPIARKVIGGSSLTWLQDLTLDTETFAGRLTFAAEADPKKLFGEAEITIEAVDDTHSRRRISGDLHVKVPLIGGTAERKIVPGLVRRLDVEADAVRAEIATR